MVSSASCTLNMFRRASSIAFLHRHRNFTGLAATHADVTFAIAHHGQRGKAENPAAFNHLGYAANVDQLLLVAVFPARVSIFWISHNDLTDFLEFEAAFTGRVGECLDPTVVTEPGSVKSHGFHSGGEGLLGKQLADGAGCLHIPGILHFLTQGSVQGGCRSQHFLAIGVDHLGIESAAASCVPSVGPLPARRCGPWSCAPVSVSTFSCHSFQFLQLIDREVVLLLLRLLADHVLVRVANAFTLVRLGRTKRADFRRGLAQNLLVREERSTMVVWLGVSAVTPSGNS